MQFPHIVFNYCLGRTLPMFMMVGKFKQCVWIQCCANLSKSVQILKMLLPDFWQTFFRLNTVFCMACLFPGQLSIGSRWRSFRVTNHQQNVRKYGKKILWPHPWGPLPKNSSLLSHDWNQLLRLSEHPWELSDTNLDNKSFKYVCPKYKDLYIFVNVKVLFLS